ncbi:MAG: hypothetical protein US76_02520 [Parcubacteria group bacterium GW2011_GWA2_38_13b]|nr:MAG: hypothetical protein US76_02520 [Parcubacteria group bacterium GW2011_GWA2_38_13b]
MNTDKFQKEYRKLNPEQKKAVDAVEGPVMVIAGPGTGKTQILTLRIANILLKTDTAPENILALTFTESGAHSIRQRLLGIMGGAAYKVNISTFHGFCNELIVSYPDEFPRIISSKSATEIDQIRIIENIINSGKIKKLRPYGDSLYYVWPALKAIRGLKREGVTIDDFNKIIKDEEDKFQSIDDLYYEKGAHKGKMKGKYKQMEHRAEKNKELAVIYEEYQKQMEEVGFYDYEDMIMETALAMKKNNDFLLALQEEYQYILADEHQDTNNAQNKIIEFLADFYERPNLFIVGDEKQAIFRFQGASLNNFLYFKDKYPDVLLITLGENYRSGQAILDSAHSLMEKSGDSSEIKRIRLRARTEIASQKIKIFCFSKPEHEYLFLVDEIRKKIKDGTPAEEIAVFYRDNRDVFEIARQFEKTEIPFVIESDRDLLSDEDIKKLILIFRAINALGDDNLLAETLYIDFLNLENLDIYKALNYANKHKIPLYDVMKSKKTLSEAGMEHPEKLIDLRVKMDYWKIAAVNKSLLDFFDIVVRESGFLGYILAQAGSFDRMAKLDGLFNEARKLMENHRECGVKDFISYIDTLKKYEVSVGSRGRNFSGGARLMTAHKSKGLEFDYVYIVGAHDKHWGGRRQRSDFRIFANGAPIISFNDDDDERRLFYVAITRARKAVSISYSTEGWDGRNQLPSRFIEEIDGKFMEKVDVLKMEKNFVDRRGEKFLPKINFGPHISDKKYLRKLFLEKGFSVTALNNYLECPWKFFFNNLAQIPKPPGKFQIYGSAVHGSLKEYFDRFKIDSDVGKDFILRRFERYLGYKALSPVDYQELLEKGKKSLNGYYDFYHNLWQKKVFNEFKIKGVLFDFDFRKEKIELILKGNLDKIEILQDSDVNVVDYKTGKPKSRNDIEGKTKNSRGDYKRQIVFYRILLDYYEKGKYKMVSGELDFVEPDDRGRYHKEKFIIEEKDIEELKKTIQKTAQEIYDLSFWDKTCKDKKCEYCGIRKMMK